MSEERRSIGVVIPYYQRERGILVRALLSVAAQKYVTDVLVVVVDDSSPIPAVSEVADLQGTFPFDLEIIAQPNAGPGAARNTGINALSTRVRYIAFLDSDDEWCDEHLRRGVLALAEGFDVYFADHLQLRANECAFARAGRIRSDVHPLVCGLDEIYAYSGDMISQILTGNVIGTSTVLYDWERFPVAAFRQEYRNAGEDYLFWLELAKLGGRFVFSTRREATYGKGINVYASAGWGTEMHFLRLHNEMKYRKTVLAEFELKDSLRTMVKADITRLRHALARDLLHRVTHRTGLRIDWARAHARLDPLTYGLLPWEMLTLLADHIRGASSSSRGESRTIRRDR